MRTFLLMFAILAVMLCVAGCNHDDADCPNCHWHPAPVLAPDAPPSTTASAPVIEQPVAADPTTAGTVLPPPKTGGVKRAVLVGINQYRDPSAPPLSGCVNDAKNIQAKCISAWGFNPDCITLLTDEHATKAAIVAALSDAVAASQPGDTLLYWQSSHGAEDAVGSTAPNQPDSMNQMVCCYDFAWDREHELIDEDFVAIFSKLPAGVILSWGSDSCHSGDLDRTAYKKKRTQKTPIAPDAVRKRIARAYHRGAKLKDLTGGLANLQYLSGCKADQTSADTQDDQGVPCGAMTMYFLKNVDALANAPLTDLAKAMDQQLAADQYDQQPQAEGARSGKPWLK